MKCFVIQIDKDTKIIKGIRNYNTLSMSRFQKDVRIIPNKCFEMTYAGNIDIQKFINTNWDNFILPNKKEKG